MIYLHQIFTYIRSSSDSIVAWIQQYQRDGVFFLA